MSFKLLIAILMVPLPSAIKIFVLRTVFRHRIDRKVRIGFSVFCPARCSIGGGTRIGHFNYIVGMEELDIGRDVRIGHFNILLGGRHIALGDGALIGRFNEINSILDPIVVGRPDPSFVLERRAVVTASHKIDFTDRVVLRESAILAGRNSNIWTHNRQKVGPVEIGRNCYVGSSVQFTPGAGVGDYCVIGLGSVVTKRFTDRYKLIAGVPARAIKDLDDEGRFFVSFPTRPDLDGMPDLGTAAGAGDR